MKSVGIQETKRETKGLPEMPNPPVVCQTEISTSPAVATPVLIAFAILTWSYIERGNGHEFLESHWAIATCALLLALVTVLSRRYDGWKLEGSRIVVESGKIQRSYNISDVEAVRSRQLFTGLASVNRSVHEPCQKSFGLRGKEVTLRMSNGDRTTILTTPDDNALPTIMSAIAESSAKVLSPAFRQGAPN
jgi:hypothetical protein